MNFAVRTECMAMMLDRNAQDLEGMHANGHTLHSLLALQDQIDRARKQIDKGVAIGCCQKDAPKFEFHHLAHSLHGDLYLWSPIPMSILG